MKELHNKLNIAQNNYSFATFIFKKSNTKHLFTPFSPLSETRCGVEVTRGAANDLATLNVYVVKFTSLDSKRDKFST